MQRGKKLQEEPMHLGLNATTTSLTKITGMEWYEQYDKDTEADGAEGRLVTMHAFTEPWSMWEMHPVGEECVICTSGEIMLHQDKSGDGSNVQTTLLKAGEYAINGKGVWHTADCHTPCAAIFITPGKGTQHKPRDDKTGD